MQTPQKGLWDLFSDASPGRGARRKQTFELTKTRGMLQKIAHATSYFIHEDKFRAAFTGTPFARTLTYGGSLGRTWKTGREAFPRPSVLARVSGLSGREDWFKKSNGPTRVLLLLNVTGRCCRGVERGLQKLAFAGSACAHVLFSVFSWSVACRLCSRVRFSKPSLACATV